MAARQQHRRPTKPPPRSRLEGSRKWGSSQGAWGQLGGSPRRTHRNARFGPLGQIICQTAPDQRKRISSQAEVGHWFTRTYSVRHFAKVGVASSNLVVRSRPAPVIGTWSNPCESPQILGAFVVFGVVPAGSPRLRLAHVATNPGTQRDVPRRTQTQQSCSRSVGILSCGLGGTWSRSSHPLSCWLAWHARVDGRNLTVDSSPDRTYAPAIRGDRVRADEGGICGGFVCHADSDASCVPRGLRGSCDACGSRGAREPSTVTNRSGANRFF